MTSHGSSTSPPPAGRPPLGVVVVSYNSAPVLEACLKSCRAHTAAAVVVVDNASEDDSAAVARRVGAEVYANPCNRGFAAAVNQGVEALAAEFILLLNPDAELLTPIDALIDACREAGVAAAAGALADAQGEFQRGFSVRRLPRASTLIFETLGFNRLFPWNAVNRRYRCSGFDASQPAFVEQPAGAFFLFRRDAWEAVGKFDERFWPLWFEDVDFCARLHAAGLRIRYVPEVRAAHLGGHSAGRLEKRQKMGYWYASLLKYSDKWCSRAGFRLVCASVLLRCAAAGVSRGAGPRSARRKDLHLPVRLALAGMRYGSLAHSPGDRPASLD